MFCWTEMEPQQCEERAREVERTEWLQHTNQLEKFYVEDLRALLASSQMVAFFHTNPIAKCNFRKAWQVRA